MDTEKKKEVARKIAGKAPELGKMALMMTDNPHSQELSQVAEQEGYCRFRITIKNDHGHSRTLTTYRKPDDETLNLHRVIEEITGADAGERVQVAVLGQLVDDIAERVRPPDRLVKLMSLPVTMRAGDGTVLGKPPFLSFLKRGFLGGRKPGKSETAKQKRLELAQDYGDTVNEYEQLGERKLTISEFAHSRRTSASTIKTALREYDELKRGVKKSS